MRDDLIINFTPTGMVPQKGMNPAVPISPEEIVDSVSEAVELGITLAHLHAREPDGTPSSSRDIYEKILSGVRSRHPELVVCVSLSGRKSGDFATRTQPIDFSGELKPDLGSLTLSSLNFPGQASVNAPEMIRALALKMQAQRVVPELEIFDLGMINYFRYLMERQLLQGPFYANILLGNIAGAQADLLQAGLLIRDLPAGTLWSLGGIGAAQLEANTMAILAGGGVRVGLEDNLYWDASRSRTTTNRELLTRVHQLAAIFGRRAMSPAELRLRLQLEPGFGRYGRKVEAEA
ncbi:MAG TPA: 3-keto-5-aminohexanoate cleavage protein [Chthoniobacterales bacterium]